MADLAERIDAELENLDRILVKIPTSVELPSLSELELAGVAALVSSFYNGLENILKQIMRARDVSLPTGESWHRELVETACRERILSEEMRDGIKEFLAFRHFFAHAYAFDIDPARLEPLVEKLPSLYQIFRRDCTGAAVDGE
jgi:hypothetical protein